MADGNMVTMGGVTLTAHLWPGYTKGVTNWTMPLEDGGRTYHVVFPGSVSIADPTPLLRNPECPTIVADNEATFKKRKTLPGDVFLASHADQFGLSAKLKRLDPDVSPNPFIDREGWKKGFASAENSFIKQLATEKAAR